MTHRILKGSPGGKLSRRLEPPYPKVPPVPEAAFRLGVHEQAPSESTALENSS